MLKSDSLITQHFFIRIPFYHPTVEVFPPRFLQNLQFVSFIHLYTVILVPQIFFAINISRLKYFYNIQNSVLFTISPTSAPAYIQLKGI